jgi:hypothetical protein
VILEPGKKAFISRHILRQRRYACPIALPVRRNPQHGSHLTVVSATSGSPLQLLRHQRNIFHQVVNRFTRQTLPTVNRKYFFINILCIESFCLQKKKKAQQKASLRYGRHIDYWNKPLNMRMLICYLDCHEAGVCCYLVIQKIYYIHYSCFTFICDLFTDSSS